MSWATILERLYVKGKIDSRKIDDVQTQGLITETEATKIKAEYGSGV